MPGISGLTFTVTGPFASADNDLLTGSAVNIGLHVDDWEWEILGQSVVVGDITVGVFQGHALDGADHLAALTADPHESRSVTFVPGAHFRACSSILWTGGSRTPRSSHRRGRSATSPNIRTSRRLTTIRTGTPPPESATIAGCAARSRTGPRTVHRFRDPGYAALTLRLRDAGDRERALVVAGELAERGHPFGSIITTRRASG